VNAMTPTASCPKCHGTKIEPNTVDLAEREQEPCRRCQGQGELLIPKKPIDMKRAA
jgi:DnaJ-class molecular chaperone